MKAPSLIGAQWWALKVAITGSIKAATGLHLESILEIGGLSEQGDARTSDVGYRMDRSGSNGRSNYRLPSDRLEN
jgi:hypothetical protein